MHGFHVQRIVQDYLLFLDCEAIYKFENKRQSDVKVATFSLDFGVTTQFFWRYKGRLFFLIVSYIDDVPSVNRCSTNALN